MSVIRCCFAVYLGSLWALVSVAVSPDSYFFPNLDNVGNNATLFPMPSCGGFTLEEATIDQMQDAMSHGVLNAQQLLVCYMERIYQTQPFIK